ncbi:MAG: hypothetical protein ACRDH7_07570 [Actinomycetota bacterium]
MRRILIAALVATLLTGTMTMTAQAEQLGRWRGFCSTWREGENLTPARFHANPDAARAKIRRLIVCVFAKFAPGESGVALVVADRESGLYPWAQNPSSLCSGLFQHILSAWPSRAESYLKRWMFGPGVSWPPPWSDPRANTIVAAKMVADPNIGWTPWS